MANFKIDIEVNARDNTGGAMQSAASKVTAFEKSVQKTNAQLQKLTGKNANININAQDRASSVIDRVLAKLKGSRAGQLVISAIDRASSVINNIHAKLKGSRAGQFVLSALDRAGPVISKIGTQLKSLAGKAWNIAVNIAGNAKDRLSQIGNGLGRMAKGAATAIGLGGTFAVGSAVKSAIDFEDSFAGVTKTVEGTTEQLAGIKQAIIDMTTTGINGHSAIPMTTAELNELAAAGGQLGISTDNIADFTETMAMLGSATNLSGESGAQTLARFLNVTGTSQKYISNLGSSIVELGNNFATTEAEIADMAMNMGATGKQIGMTAPQILGYSAALSSLGMEATSGGSSISRVWMDIQRAVSAGGEDLSKFAKISGKSSQAFADSWKKDAAAAFQEFTKGLGQSNDVVSTLTDLGFNNIRDINALMRLSGDSGQKLLTDAMKKANDAWSDNSALLKEFNTRAGTTASKITILKNNLVDAGRRIGAAFLPVIGEAAEKLGVAVSNATKKAQPYLDDLESLFTDPTKMSSGMLEKYITAGKPDTLGGKLQFAWDELIAEPLGNWWSETGHAKAAEFAAGFGKGCGAAISGGLTALFGLTNAMGDGVSIAGSFLDGFKEGFKEFDPGAAIAEAFKSHPIASGLISNWLLKEFTGINIPEILMRKLFGGGGGAGLGGAGTYSCATMEVNAGVVNVNGGKVNDGSAQPGSSGSRQTQPNTPGTTPETTPRLPAPNTGVGTPALGPGESAGAKMLGGGAAAGGGAKLLGAGTGGGAATGGSLPAWAGEGVYDSAGNLLWTASDFAPGVNPIFAGTAIGGMALAAGYMGWNESGLNPKNYTIGQKREKGYFDVKPAEMTSGEGATTGAASKLSKAANSRGTAVLKKFMDFGDAITGWMFPKAHAADLEEATLATTSKKSKSGSKKASDFYSDFLESSGKSKIPIDADIFDTKDVGSGLMSKIGDSVSDADMSSLSIGEQLMSMISQDLDGLDLEGAGIGESLMNAIGGSLESVDLEGIGIGEQLMGAIGSSLEAMDMENISIGESLMNAIGGSLEGMDMENISIGESLMNSISASLEGMDMDNIGIGEQIMNAVSASFESVDFSNLAIGEQLMSGISASLEAVDFSGVITPIMTQLEELNAIECQPTITAIDEATDIVANVQTAVDTLAATPCSPTITAIDNASSTISSIEARLTSLNGRTATVTVNIKTNGSMPAGAHFASGTSSAPGGWATINDQRGSQYTELVDQGGSLMEYGGRNVSVPLRRGARVYTADQRRRMLAALDRPHYADGIGNDEGAAWSLYTGSEDAGDSTGGVTVNVSMSPTVEINGGGESAAAIASTIKSQFKDMADDVANEIALNLTQIFPNVPARGETYC